MTPQTLRKPHWKKNVQIKVDPEVMLAAKRLAARDRRTVSSFFEPYFVRLVRRLQRQKAA
jgi:hypothetical protein